MLLLNQEFWSHLFRLFGFFSSEVNMDIRMVAAILGSSLGFIPSGSWGRGGSSLCCLFLDRLVWSSWRASYFLGNLQRLSMAGRLCSVTQVGLVLVSRRVPLPVGPPIPRGIEKVFLIRVFGTLFLAIQLNWSFSEILLEFYQDFSLFLINPENKEFFICHKACIAMIDWKILPLVYLWKENATLDHSSSFSVGIFGFCSKIFLWFSWEIAWFFRAWVCFSKCPRNPCYYVLS